MLTKLSLKVFNTLFKFSPQINFIVYTNILSGYISCFHYNLMTTSPSGELHLLWKRSSTLPAHSHLLKQS